MKKTTLVLAMMAVLLSGIFSRTHAAAIVLYNTGVDDAGVSLPSGTIGDPHYVLVSVPGGSSSTVRAITSIDAFQVHPGVWLPDSSISAWIGPDNAPDLSLSPGGIYDYQTTFSLSGYDSATTLIFGRWAADNGGVDILLNGVSLGLAAPATAYNIWTDFTLSGPFLPDLNTLTFRTRNFEPDNPGSANPTGLRVEVTGTGTGTSVPEPSSLGLLGIGLVCIGGLVAGNIRKAKDRPSKTSLANRPALFR